MEGEEMEPKWIPDLKHMVSSPALEKNPETFRSRFSKHLTL